MLNHKFYHMDSHNACAFLHFKICHQFTELFRFVDKESAVDASSSDEDAFCWLVVLTCSCPRLSAPPGVLLAGRVSYLLHQVRSLFDIRHYFL